MLRITNPITRLKGANELSGRRIRWGNLISAYTAKIVYRPGKWNYLADALSRLHEEPDNNPHYAKDPTEEDENDTTPIYALFSRPQDLQTMSRYEPLPVFGHSECGSDCSLNEATEGDDMKLEEDLTGGLPPITEAPRVPTTTGPVSTDRWKDKESYHSGRSNDEIEHSALHWTACKDEHCEYHGDHNTYRERTVSMPSSPPIVYPELPKSTSASPPVSGSPLSTRSRPDLSVLKRRLENAVLCNQTMHQECNEPNCSAHRRHRKRPLYSSAFTHSNATISAIEPPQLPHHERRLYEVYDDATDEVENDLPRLERVQDERDVVQAATELEGMWREQMIRGYRQDPIRKLANDSTATARGGKTQHYSIGNGLLYATTRGGERCLYIPKGHATNGETLRELAISEIHNKEHHCAQRKL